MRHHNTVFHDLTKQIDWAAFERCVAAHGGDHRVRRLRCRDQFLAMIYAQLSGARSLREVVAGLASQHHRLHHAGARPAARSTLADANAQRPAAIFEDMFRQMAAGAARRLRRALREVRIPSVSGNTASPKPCHAYGALGLLASVF